MINRSNKHESVLNSQVIEALKINSSGIYVDCTLGRAGHSSQILEKLNSNGRLIGIDKDNEAIEYSMTKLSEISKNFTLQKIDYSNVKDLLISLKISQVDGFLYDLGVSSPQLDNADRGFSYRFDSRLDMRMDQNQKLDAHYVVNSYSFEQLQKIFRNYANSKYASKIAQKIIESRPIDSTNRLVEAIKSTLPAFELRKPGHPAKKYFQAIRIEVNDELNSLKNSLASIIPFLKVGGRICVISFHSLEDSVVKKIFKDLITTKIPRDLPVIIDDVKFKIINIKDNVATNDEVMENNRSRSAKIRVIERIKN